MKKNKLRYGNIIAESYYNQDENNGIVIIFCSGVPGVSHYEDIAKKYVDQGFIFIHPKYIGSWESYGDFTLEGCRETIITLVDGLHKGKVQTIFGDAFDLPFSKIFLFGHSFGGSIALSSGAECQNDGIIALAPVLDYSTHAQDPKISEEDLSWLYLFLQKGFENVYRNMQKKDWDNLSKTGSTISPIKYVDLLSKKQILLMHGKNDMAIHVSRSRDFAKKLVNIKYIETGDDHSNLKHTAFDEVIAFIQDE